MTKQPSYRFMSYIEPWEEKKLGNLGSVEMCRRIFKEETSAEFEIPFFKIGTFGGEADTYITREKFEEYKTKFAYPQRGDLLLSASGSIGRVVEYDGDEAYYQDSNIVWLNHHGKINNKFLKAFYEIVSWSGIEGTTIKRLYNKNILETDISLPFLPEQTAIGSFFQDIDQFISLQQRKLEVLKEQKKTYLKLLFPVKGQTKPALRFAGFEDEWKEVKLGEVAEIYDGTHQTPIYTTEGVMFLSVENIRTLNSDKYISKDAFDKDFKISPKSGDVLMTRIGDIGTSNIVETDLDLAYYVSLALIRSSAIESKFLNVSISSDYFQKELWKRTLHIAFPKKINKNEIGQSKFYYPTLPEQEAIGSFFQDLDKAIAKQEEKVNQLKESKQTLLRKMFI